MTFPLRQMSVQFEYHYNPEHEAAIKRYEDHLPRDKDLKTKIIAGQSPANEIVRSLTSDDLLVMGFSQKTDFERHIINDLSNQLLNSAPGPVIMISQIEWHRGLRGTFEHGIAAAQPAVDAG